MLLISSQACRLAQKQTDYDAIIAKYGLAFNEERKKDSLPILPTHWKVVNKQAAYIEWAADEELFKYKGYIMKSIHFDLQGNIISETDIWYSGKKNPCGEDQKPEEERLFLTFDFNKLKQNEYPWKSEAVCSPSYEKKLFAQHNLVHEHLIFDTLLTELGMKRLNY